MPQNQAPTVIRSILTFLLLPPLTSCTVLAGPPTPPSFPSFTPPPINTPAPVPSPTASPTPIPALPRAIYRLDTLMDYDRHAVTVDETILYPNQTGQALDHLVLAVVPNLWAGCFTLDSLSIGGETSTNFLLDGQRMDLTLASPLGPGQVVT